MSAVARATPAPEVTCGCCGRRVKLATLNLIAAILHFVLFLIVLVSFYFVDDNSDKGRFSTYRIHVPLVDDTKRAQQVLSLKRVGSLPLPALLLAFCLITVAAHVAYFRGRDTWYAAAMRAGTNQWRYLEYGLSATIMIIIISLLASARVVSFIITLVTSSIGMFLAGAAAEEATSRGAQWREKAVWQPMAAGFVLLMGMFGGIIVDFATTANDSTSAPSTSGEESGPPDFVYAVVAVEVILFSSFGFIALWYSVKRDFPATEVAYIVLSFVAKATLVGLLTGGLTGGSAE